MALQRFVGGRYTSLSTDTRPSNAAEGSTLVTTDDGKVYYYSGGWVPIAGSNSSVSFSGFSGGSSGFVSVAKDYIVTTAPTGRRTDIILPNNQYISGGAEKFQVYVEGVLQLRDTGTGLANNDYWISNTGNSSSPGRIWLNYAIPPDTQISFNYILSLIFLLVIL